MRDLVIVGAGGFGREVLQIVLDCNAVTPTWRFVGFLDEAVAKHRSLVHGYPVLGGLGWLADHPATEVILAMGNPPAKRKIDLELRRMGHATFATVVHPRAWHGRNVELGAGTVVCAGVMITCDVVIGRHVILNLNATVGHDARLEDYATLLPAVNVSGNVHVGEGADLGTASVLLPAVSVGAWSIVGAGAVVVGDLPADITAVGTPAKVIKQRTAGWHEA